MNALLNWLDVRTGYKSLVREALYENVPGGARWRYVWGSTLVFTFSVQMITGLFLWMAYSPSTQTAWESVYYIQHEMTFGWLLRGIHHFTAQAMVVLLAVHLMQVVIDGAYKAPREVNFWLGLVLMQIVLGLSLTGYLLPWDQKGYWATRVATNIAGITPVIGPQVQQLLVGGTNYGHQTLTRFFAMHAGLLPALLVAFLVMHIAVFRRHGLTAPDAEWKANATFWPDQVLKDAVACLAVLAAVLLCVCLHGPGPHGGAELGAPADHTDKYDAARPEWYFLFLFQFLKFFEGTNEIYGAMVIPGAIMGFLFLMPFIGGWKLGHRFNVLFLFTLLAGVGWLTWQAVQEDRHNPDHELAVRDAEAKAARIKVLVALKGIGPVGAKQLLRDDSKTQGPVLFKKYCAGCHRYDGHDGTGTRPADVATASDLALLGTRDWIRGMMTSPADDRHFGMTRHGSFDGQTLGDRFTDGEMAKWVAENVHARLMKDEDVAAVVEFLAGQSGRADVAPLNAKQAAAGKQFFAEGSDAVSTTCYSCHEMRLKDELFESGSAGVAAGPDLTGYCSETWLREFISNPGQKKFYGKRNAMPAFADRLSEKDLNLLVEWLLHRWPEPAPPK